MEGWSKEAPSTLSLSSAVVISGDNLGLWHDEAGTDPVTSLEFQSVQFQPPLDSLSNEAGVWVFVENRSDIDLTLIAPCGDVESPPGTVIGRMDTGLYRIGSQERIGNTCDRDVTLAPGEMVRANTHIHLEDGLADGDYNFTTVFGAVGEVEPQSNQPPVADANGPYTIELDQALVLDGSASADPDAGDSIVSYEWDLDNDGAFDDATGVGPTTPFSALQGLPVDTPNPIALRVTDGSGASDTDKTTLLILTGAPVLDQSQTDSTGAAGSTDQWQSITAGITGLLTRVDLMVGSGLLGADTKQDGTIMIYDGEGTGGTLLATENVEFRSQNTAMTFQQFNLSGPPSVVSGQMYTIRFSVPTVDVGWVALHTGNPYPLGKADVTHDPNWDYLFKTFVASSSPPPAFDLAAAIAAASAGDTINIPAGTHTVSPALNINKDLTLAGAGAASTIIQAAENPGQANDRVIFVGSFVVNIRNVTIRNGNTAGDGGGLYNTGTLTLEASTVSGNAAGSLAGGIYNSGPMTINDSTVSGNTAGAVGAGIGNCCNSGTLNINNSTISGNTTNGNGGGIYNQRPLFINNSTITDNTAGGSGGGGISNNSTLNFKNTIIAGNNTTTTGPDCSGGPMTSEQHNLVQDVTGCTIVGDLTGNITGQDPLLGVLADNGGPTQTHALTSGSPAIDTGHPATPGTGGNACEANDQRGITRPQGSACDIGAFELVN